MTHPANEAVTGSGNDLRSELYSRYLSAFKGDPRQQVDVTKFHAWCDYKLKPWLNSLHADATLLDIGCGPGYMLGYLEYLGFNNCEGIDLSAEQVQIARRLGHVAHVADVFDYLKGKTNSLDAILAIDVVEHFTKLEFRDLQELIAAALKPNGLFILQTPNGQGVFAGHIIYGDLSHASIYTPGSLTQMLSLAGFKDFQWRETGAVPRGVYGVLRTSAWCLVRRALNILSRIACGRSQQLWTDNMLCCCRIDKPIGNGASN